MNQSSVGQNELGQSLRFGGMGVGKMQINRFTSAHRLTAKCRFLLLLLLELFSRFGAKKRSLKWRVGDHENFDLMRNGVQDQLENPSQSERTRPKGRRIQTKVKRNRRLEKSSHLKFECHDICTSDHSQNDTLSQEQCSTDWTFEICMTSNYRPTGHCLTVHFSLLKWAAVDEMSFGKVSR